VTINIATLLLSNTNKLKTFIMTTQNLTKIEREKVHF